MVLSLWMPSVEEPFSLSTELGDENDRCTAALLAGAGAAGAGAGAVAVPTGAAAPSAAVTPSIADVDGTEAMR